MDTSAPRGCKDFVRRGKPRSEEGGVRPKKSPPRSRGGRGKRQMRGLAYFAAGGAGRSEFHVSRMYSHWPLMRRWTDR